MIDLKYGNTFLTCNQFAEYILHATACFFYEHLFILLFKTMTGSYLFLPRLISTYTNYTKSLACSGLSVSERILMATNFPSNRFMSIKKRPLPEFPSVSTIALSPTDVFIHWKYEPFKDPSNVVSGSAPEWSQFLRLISTPATDSWLVLLVVLLVFNRRFGRLSFAMDDRGIQLHVHSNNDFHDGSHLLQRHSCHETKDM